MSQAARLPDFPWDSIAGEKALAERHPDGIVNLSVGTPVDPTPDIVQDALRAAADSPGYPTVWGTPAVRQAIVGYLQRRWRAGDLPDEGVLPVIGTKEIVGWLPTLLDLGAGDTVVIPTTAYPTYRVGAMFAGASVVTADNPADLGDLRPRLIWINSPANPHGATLSLAATRAWVDYARARGAMLAADECYGEFGWEAEPVSVLATDVCGGDVSGLLAVHSLSKRSNMAGYRSGFVAGDSEVVGRLIGLRKHLGMMVPTPVQAAMVAGLGDHDHVVEQRERYLRRRRVLLSTLTAAGFRVDDSEGSLYLWATRDEDCRATLASLARLGILVAPGDFYDDPTHVRIALTASDERISAAAARLTAAVTRPV